MEGRSCFAYIADPLSRPNRCSRPRFSSRYIPKGADIGKLTEEPREWVEEQLNNRPRKCLGYQTPAEVFDKLCGALAG